ncbi:MAG: hypothetical protein ACI9TY_000688 [Alphaproteobacteria bacterium]
MRIEVGRSQATIFIPLTGFYIKKPCTLQGFFVAVNKKGNVMDARTKVGAKMNMKTKN